MTLRLYYDDPYLTRFLARVVERLQWGDHPAVVLDRTAFYPTGGGQPHDTGILCSAGAPGDVPVVDVVEREPDGAVIHLLAAPLLADDVQGQVDWDRRFDLMQQHSGQHILSAAFLERYDANTVGFHLSEGYSTIDLDRVLTSAEELAQVEALANSIVFENRPVAARFVPDVEIPSLPLRKPLAHRGPVRVVDVPDFDCSACGGTHVRATGEVGLIKITRSERRSAETRVEFVCGRRALVDYQAKNTLLMDLAREFTVGHWEVADLLHRLSDDLAETRREVRQARDALLDAEAVALWHQGTMVGPVRVVRAHLAGRTPEDLKHLAQRLIANPETVALLAAGEAGHKGFFAFARSASLDLHMGTLMRRACEAIGGGGGGRPEFAQGGGPDGGGISQALEEVFQLLTDSLTTGLDT